MKWGQKLLLTETRKIVQRERLLLCYRQAMARYGTPEYYRILELVKDKDGVIRRKRETPSMD